MKSNRILDNLGNVKDEYIEEAAFPEKGSKYSDSPVKSGRPAWIKWASIAAGVIVLITAAYSISHIRLGSNASDSAQSINALNFSGGMDEAPEAMEKGYTNAAENVDAAVDINGIKSETSGSDNSQTGFPDEYGGSQKLIKTVDMTMETKEFDKCIQAINQKVSEFGGYTENFEIRGREDSNSRHASAVLRVPAAKIDEVQNAFDSIATITYSTEAKKDVTLDYVDTESRLKALKTEQSTLLRLLESASAISDIISIQSQLTNVNYRIESYESRLRLLQNKVSYSTVTINIREVSREVSVNPSFWESVRDKFADSIDDIISSSTDFTIWFIGSIPYFIIIGVIIAIIAAIVTAVKKHKKNRRA